MVDRLLRGGLALAVLTATAGLAATASTPEAHAEPECLHRSYDFNRDGNVDFVAGLPGADNGAGAVDVAYSREDIHRPHRVQPDGLSAGDEFGAAVAEVAYYENEGEDDRCSQLVVGAPGRDVDGKADAGAVFLFASTGDNQFTLVKEFVQGEDGVPGTPQEGARFGAALAAPFHGDDIGPVVTPLYVGAPGATIGGAAGAGQVLRLTFGGTGPEVTESAVIAQGSGVPGTSEAGDAFGASLAAVTSGLIAGVPGENGGAGGVVHWVAADPTRSRFVTQNTTGVPGKSEAGDRFGHAVVWAPSLPGGIGVHVLVGAPGEAIGSLRQAGSAIVFKDTLSLSGVKGYHQDTPGIAGAAEAGDRFGTALATWGAKDLIAGVPGEDIGTKKDAGMVNSLSRNLYWNQNSADIPGTAEAGDLFGHSLAIPTVQQGGESQFWYSPIVGVPGENDGAGLAYYGLVGDGLAREVWVPTETHPGDRFGASTGKVN